ncbi:MAG: radical SAM protein [Oligoflexia bacterium]|nr:radical SAM protein [Oligoflexia bacterium]
MKMTTLSLISLGLNDKYYPYGLFCLYEYLVSKTNACITIDEFDGAESFADSLTGNYKYGESDYIGFSCYTWNVSEVKLAITHFKKLFPDKKVIIGGPSAYEFIDNQNVNYISMGAGEKNLEALISGESSNRVLSYKITPDEKVYPFYNKKLLEIAKEHQYVPVEMASGCGFQCAYCTQGIEKYKARSLDSIYDELACLKSNDVSHVNILDTTFNIDKARFALITEMLRKLEITWHAEIKVDIMDKDCLVLLNNSTCTSVEIGLQSISVQTNKLINSKFSLDTFKNNLSLVDPNKMNIRVNTIIGLPGEGFQDWLKTIIFMMENFNCEITSGVLRLYPDASLYQSKELYGYEYDSDNEYTITGTNNMSAQEILLAEVISKIIKHSWNKFSSNEKNSVRDYVKNSFADSFEQYLFFILKMLKSNSDLRLGKGIKSFLVSNGVF